jgi:hypothetical protein
MLPAGISSDTLRAGAMSMIREAECVVKANDKHKEDPEGIGTGTIEMGQWKVAVFENKDF